MSVFVTQDGASKIMTEKVVLITGCSSGIGKALALEFKKHNFRVFASARTVSKLSALKDAGIDTVQLDVTNKDSMERAVDSVLTQAGRIDILVNNAGLASYAPSIDVSDEELRTMFETNFFGAIKLTQLVAHKFMLSARLGTVVSILFALIDTHFVDFLQLISSIMGEISLPFSGVYSATKAALSILSDALRMELAPFNINVVTIKPGGVQSDIADNATEKTASLFVGESTYKLIASEIQSSVQGSQIGAMPAAEFAEKVVARIILPKPPATMILASKSRIAWFISKFVPPWLSDWLFASLCGTSLLRQRLAQQKEE